MMSIFTIQYKCKVNGHVEKRVVSKTLDVLTLPNVYIYIYLYIQNLFL